MQKTLRNVKPREWSIQYNRLNYLANSTATVALLWVASMLPDDLAYTQYYFPSRDTGASNGNNADATSMKEEMAPKYLDRPWPTGYTCLL
jgi:hypothetical protein